MLTLPEFVMREAAPYVAIRKRVAMKAIPTFVDSAFPALFGWLERNAVAQAGAAFLKYNVIDMDGELEIEAGIPLVAPVEGDGEFLAGTLPGGRYATTTYTGPYDDLYDVNAVLIGWAKEKGVTWDASNAEDGDHFACRLEIYETDPAEEPDPAKWITEVLIKVRD